MAKIVSITTVAYESIAITTDASATVVVSKRRADGPPSMMRVPLVHNHFGPKP
jgi:hypothetical protein